MTMAKEIVWGRYEANVLRVTVERWEDDIIHVCDTASGRHLHVCFGSRNHYLTREGKCDWTYLQKILETGVTLNLVRVRWEGGLCLPELILYEPDYLIHITTIASCFDEHLKETPFVGLIHKVKKDEASLATHLGNLAGQLLDDALHQSHETYEESYASLLNDKAMRIACMQGMNEVGKEEA